MRAMEPHPIRLVVEDDLRRSRVTVFFRLILAIPHLIWISLWGLAVFVIAIISWFIVLFSGRLPVSLHDFFAKFVRYSTHLYAYLYLAANRYPGFVGKPGDYAVDLVVDGAAPQSRWKTAFRILLAVPALLVAATLAGAPLGGGGWGGEYSSGSSGGDDEWWWSVALSFGGNTGVVVVTAIFGWFVCVALGRMPLGFRDLAAYGLRYSAQTMAYLLFLTDRYPNADPRVPSATQPTPEKPIGIRVEDDLRRSRLTVFFRLLLTIPHIVWLVLWGIAVVFALIAGWFATLVTGRLPEALHRFLAAYLRYQTHVFAFLYLVANPFPGFAGAAGSYPVDLEIAPRERQNRWKTFFRSLLAWPAVVVAAVLAGALGTVALLGWFVGLFLGRMPEGLRNLGAYALRYNAQTYGYLFLLTDSYPYSGPTEYVGPEPDEPKDLPAWPGPLPLPSPSS